MKINQKILLASFSTLILAGPISIGLVSSLTVDNNNKKIDSINNIDDSIDPVGMPIDATKCFVEADVSKTANEWMGITGNGHINFIITKIANGSQAGEVSIKDVSDKTIISNKLDIPSKIIFNSNTYNVTSIDSQALAGCDNLSGTLTISNSVTIIANAAFSNCIGLTGLQFDQNTKLESIGVNAFSGCIKIKGILTIPSTVKNIGGSAFSNCLELTGLNLANATNLTVINDDVFIDCTGLTGTLVIPSNIKSIGSEAFDSCVGLTSLDLTQAKNLISIRPNAFAQCNKIIGTLTIPSSVTGIGDYAFMNLALTDVYFSTLPSTLGNGIFNTTTLDENESILIKISKGSKPSWIATTDILKKMGVASIDQFIESEPKTSIDFPWWAILIIVAGSMLVIGATTITIVLVKRKNKIK